MFHFFVTFPYAHLTKCCNLGPWCGEVNGEEVLQLALGFGCGDDAV